MPQRRGLRTWVEISRKAIRHNVRIFRKLVGPKVKLWAVVKSNAYGHGLYAFAPLAEKEGVDPVRNSPPQGSSGARLRAGEISNGVDGFCVDSVVEGLALRRAGIRKPILTLGPTLPPRLPQARDKNIAVSVSSFESLNSILRLKDPPKFHLKIDTGMHRLGFAPNDLGEVIRRISKSTRPNDRNRPVGREAQISKRVEGIFTHFAAAKDLKNTAYTRKQSEQFDAALGKFRAAGFKRFTAHAAATGGTMLGQRYHYDAVRVGIGLYGLWPSPELERQLGSRFRLEPVLAWQTAVAEVKRLQPGDHIGYDLTERIDRPTTAAVLPIGYWHGFPRALSSKGIVLIRGKRCRVLGRVSMAMVVVNATQARPKVGDTAILIGRQGRDELSAGEVAARAGTIHYEIVTRLNPLMERVVV